MQTLHPAEVRKINVEIAKMKSEMFWQPIKIAAALIGSVAAITATIMTLILKVL
ncbi:hypothetical protein DTO96_102441 [Ephemeroptericola cinctiostellae]|uniref:Uncharacterized protein n=1 Tax=Ephemeroptericola cinctiostellae TaxID=2268024 RepID=A0A345DE98_9BURK|nr:hypothetical protein [Ephemeroptericola cinctiostellae]AXF86686.1 hypothetical protein DTO96_102441 [Ephemeroptericola cinctiostellae]